LYHAPVVNPADYLPITRCAAPTMALRVVVSGAMTSTARGSAFL